MSEFPVTPMNRLRRHAERGSYDRETIYPILDEAMICHVGFAIDGQPFVIPTIHARMGDTLLLHGLKGGRMLKHIDAGHDICVAVTLLDGLVLARTVFNHSMNYRSVVMYGSGASISDPVDKLEALRHLTERMAPGRWGDARLPDEKELKQTTIVAIHIDAATAKVREGEPGDDGEDLLHPAWAGVLPMAVVPQEPVPDPRQQGAFPLPDYLVRYRLPGR